MNVGVIASSSLSLQYLQRLVRGAGHMVGASIDLNRLVMPLPAVDVWVANLDLHDPVAEAVVDQLDSLGVPVIYDDDLLLATPRGASVEMESGSQQKREKQLGSKLRQLVWESPADKPARRAEYVWVLGASTGGPEAVTQFLKGIPEDLARIAFIYVQHTETHAIDNLQRVVTRQTCWQVERVDAARVIREKTVYLISPAHQIELDGGVLSPTSDVWVGPFRPSIDQVIAKVARAYGGRGGAIIFSGMGDDGAKSSTLLHHRGGLVWTQAHATCTVDSMPSSVEKRGCVAFSAAPAELAQRFVTLHKYGTRPLKSMSQPV